MDLKHMSRLHKRFSILYLDKFLKHFKTEADTQEWCLLWLNGLKDIEPTAVRDALEYCTNYVEWPPTVAEFRKICEQYEGIPHESEAFRLALRKEFTHPIVKMAFEKIGSWDFSHDKEAVLINKFGKAYEMSLREYRVDKDKCWNALLASPLQPPQLEYVKPKKKMTESEKKSVHEIIAECKRRLKETNPEKMDLKYEKGSITKGHRNFDQNIFNERKNYLLNLSEIDAGALSTEDYYDRCRFKREQESSRHFQIHAYNGDRIKNKVSSKPFKSTVLNMRDYMNAEK